MANETLGLEITELRLGLPGEAGGGISGKPNGKKRVFPEATPENDRKNGPAMKSQMVGWPPVCSYRRKNSFERRVRTINITTKMYVKVSVDGAPFLRKIDLGGYKGYNDLASALEKLFGCSGIGEKMKDGERCEYVPIYEDKDGDWMLAGDVPWEMFIESCKRMRITKKSDAKVFGLQHRGCTHQT